MKITVFCQITIDGKLTIGETNSSKVLFESFTKEDVEFIHKFRGSVDAIMVGRKTIKTDNPFLTNRFEENRNPLRVIPTSTMDISPSSNILSDSHPTLIVTTENGYKKDFLREISAPNKNVIICGKEKVDFVKLFELLEKEFKISSIMVEGGGYLNWEVFSKSLVDEIILMQLPIIAGGISTPSMVDGIGYTEYAQANHFKLHEFKQLGNYNYIKFLKN